MCVTHLLYRHNRRNGRGNGIRRRRHHRFDIHALHRASLLRYQSFCQIGKLGKLRQVKRIFSDRPKAHRDAFVRIAVSFWIFILSCRILCCLNFYFYVEEIREQVKDS